MSEKQGRLPIDDRLKDLPRDVLLGILANIQAQSFLDWDDLIRKGKQAALIAKSDQEWTKYQGLRAKMKEEQTCSARWLQLSAASINTAKRSEAYKKQADALWEKDT